MRNSIPGVALVVASGAIVVALVTGCTAAAVVPPNATDAEVDSYLDSRPDFLGPFIKPGRLVADGRITIPDVPRVAFTTPDTWSTVQTSCLQAAGLQAREISGGFTIDDSGDLDTTAVSLAQWTCLRQYPVDPRLTGFLSEAQALYMYDYFTRWLAPCLASLGEDVPRPPRRDEYVELLRDGTAWNPYYRSNGAPVADSPAQWARVNSTCPALPDDPFRSYRPELPRTGAED